MAPAGASRRASGFLGARRAPLPSVSLRYTLPMAVNPAISAFATLSGASCWTPLGSCARRGCGLALPERCGVRIPVSASAAVEHQCLGARSRSRLVDSSSRNLFAVDRGPNPALNRTWRYVASTWRAAVAPRRLALRWASTQCVVRGDFEQLLECRLSDRHDRDGMDQIHRRRSLHGAEFSLVRPVSG